MDAVTRTIQGGVAMRIPPPCGKNCPKRELRCQASCEEYKQWEKRRREIKSKINKEKALDWLISGRR